MSANKLVQKCGMRGSVNNRINKAFKFIEQIKKFLFRTKTPHPAMSTTNYSQSIVHMSGLARRFDKISIAYHKAVKKVAGMQVWDSNHEGCDIVKVPIFKHLMTKRMICFLYSLIR